MSKLVPRRPVPPLSVPTVNGPRWVLADRKPERFSLIVFYRGLHCPICRGYLTELNRVLPDFSKRGVDVLALSSDTEDRARQTLESWSLTNLAVGYGLTLDAARTWGLYVSAGRGKSSLGIEEPAQFSEPGVFLVRPDCTLFWCAVQTMPFARPHFAEMLTALDFVLKNDYPARGELG